jgi:hypothetical protein
MILVEIGIAIIANALCPYPKNFRLQREVGGRLRMPPSAFERFSCKEQDFDGKALDAERLRCVSGKAPYLGVRWTGHSAIICNRGHPLLLYTSSLITCNKHGPRPALIF